jgi:hypothetical protein
MNNTIKLLKLISFICFLSQVGTSQPIPFLSVIFCYNKLKKGISFFTIKLHY